MSALSDLLDNEDAQCNGETIPHVCGMTSRRERVKQARAEHAALVDENERLRAENAKLGRLVRLMDTRLLHASKIADYADHKPLCRNHDTSECVCRLDEYVVEAEAFCESTLAESEALILSWNESEAARAALEPRQ